MTKSEWSPIGGDLVRIIETSHVCRVKMSDRTKRIVVVYIPSGEDEDGDTTFDCKRLTWDQIEKVN
jgi:hypothetical protein